MSEYQQGEPRRRQRLTRLGFHFVFVAAFAMLGGALRGFNLLLVLAGLMVGALLMQWRFSRRSIESMQVQRRLPTEAFAARPFRLRYLLHNGSRLMPAWMIRVEDRIQAVDQDIAASAACGAGVVGARRSFALSCDCLIMRRGRYRFGPIQLMTTFPFSLFSSRKSIDVAGELYVFPKLLTLHGRWRNRLLSRSGGVSTTVRRSGPVEGDFFGLREWQAGDSPKWIHWRTTARINELAVRQFEQQRRFDTCILVDAYSGSGEDVEALELAVSLAATFLVHLVGSPANQVVLAVAGKSSEAAMGGGSDRGKRHMLSLLADVVATDTPRLEEAAAKAMAIVGYTQEMVVVSPRSLSAVREHEKEFLSSASPWLRRSSLRWIDVSRDLDRWVSGDALTNTKSSMGPSLVRMTQEQSEVG